MKINKIVNTNENIILTNISNDSREIKENGIYFAIKGLETDGHDYIESAIANGAKVIYYTNDIDNKKYSDVYFIKTDDILKEYNDISSLFYENPSKKLNIIATTGTNGKSTTSWIIKDILDRKTKSGYIGTIGVKYDEELLPSPFTTPLPHQYNELFKKMVENDIKDVAIEVSSHGLEQRRTDFMNIKCAIMTNLTHEHLDYHKTMENYLKAKSLLFERLDEDGYAILNIDDDSYNYLKNMTKGEVISYGKSSDANYQISNIKLEPTHSAFDLIYKNENYHFETNLVAEFNIYNLTAAIIALIKNGFTIQELQKYTKDITQVVGRMEKIENDENLILVDYAHTPDGFEKIYEYVKTVNKGKVISVFGAAGRRDLEKRPILGEIASKYSDKIILTEEDQVDEDPKEIAMQIKNGITIDDVMFIESREEALEKAYELLEKNDTLVALSKGCDLYMHRKNGKEPYKSDKKILEDLIKEKNER